MNNKKKLNQVGLPVIFIILILFSFLIAMFSELREKNIPVKTITLKFDTVVDNSLNLKFDSMESSIKAKIGQVYKINFFIENQKFKEIYGKAIYEVKPSF
jgi:Cytochrome oxidase assembly factor